MIIISIPVHGFCKDFHLFRHSIPRNFIRTLAGERVVGKSDCEKSRERTKRAIKMEMESE